MKAFTQQDFKEGRYMKRYDNNPELIEAMSEWGFPHDFDVTQLPTGMFMCVVDRMSEIMKESKKK